ncbi:hypothetical protein K439DRAFT_1567789 [Ramaria rubella]|nr:hypothetical protein K439DRAFT_1567789 [Ramaria rubella]
MDMVTFDSADELYKVARAHPHATLIVRILADDMRSLCRLGLKFDILLAVVPVTVRELELDVIDRLLQPDTYGDAVMHVKAAFEMDRVARYTLSLLDVRGIFEDTHFERTAKVLREAIEAYSPDRFEEGVRVIAEPGRFSVACAFMRRTYQGAEAEATEAADPCAMYYINDGMCGSFNCILVDHQNAHPYVVMLNKLFRFRDGARHTRQAMCGVGPTFDSINHVCRVERLPASLEVGYWHGFQNI